MSLGSVTVFTDSFPGAEPHLDQAIAFARAHQAHLAAVAMAEEPPFNYVAGAEMAVEAWVGQVNVLRTSTKAVAQAARDRVAAAGLSSEARSATAVIGNVAQRAALHARYGDLAIVRAPAGDGEQLQTEILDGVLFSSGRPMLVLPGQAPKNQANSKAVIAWDGSREAARAVFDALALLKSCAEISIALVEPAGELGDEPGADIARTLGRHGLGVTVDRLPDLGKGVADALRGHAAGMGANLIVMGGYGHSKLREAIFGGVTRDMLREVEIPLLMSH